MNLNTGKYSPYHKENDTPLYINTKSNHPPCIIKELPKMIENRLSSISSDREEFEKAKDIYQDALSKSGYNHQLQYQERKEHKKKSRSRNIIWFNPPFSQNVTTNIGQKFFKLLRKHFPKGHKFHKLFNQNSIKLSYSCMPNIGRIIKSYNKRTLSSQQNNTNEQACDCRDKSKCPLNNACLNKSLAYEAEIRTSDENFPYIGITKPEFKKRFNNHQTSFRHEAYRNRTELSKKVWELKDNDKAFTISWKMAKKAFPHRGIGDHCDLCCTEKLLIIENKSEHLLNKKSELISKCRHVNEFLLKECLK